MTEPPPVRRSALILVPLLAGAATAVALGVYGRVHDPTGEPLWLGPFTDVIAMKVWFTSAVLVLVAVQLVSALWMYGRLGRPAPAWAGMLHRSVGGLAFLISVPVAANCLWALGFESYDGRVLAHSLLGCALYGAFVAKVLALQVRGLPGWAVPAAGGLLFTVAAGTGLTSAVWYLAR